MLIGLTDIFANHTRQKAREQMQIVIDIPEEVKHKVYAYGLSLCPSDKEQLIHAIMNGTPLPKGHGRLIDADDAKREWQNVLDCEVEHPRYQCTIRDVLEDAPTIIEADTEREDEG